MHRLERKPSDFSNKLLSRIFRNRTQRVPFSFLHLQIFAGGLHQNRIVFLLQLDNFWGGLASDLTSGLTNQSCKCRTLRLFEPLSPQKQDCEQNG